MQPLRKLLNGLRLLELLDAELALAHRPVVLTTMRKVGLCR